MNKNQFYLISFCVFLAVCNEINTNGTILNKTNETHLDVFEKEIEILEETINLYKKKIEILKKIRSSYQANKKLIMEYPDADLMIDINKFDFPARPFKKPLTFDSFKEKETHQKHFMNKLLMRFNQKVNVTIKDLTFLSTRQYKAGNDMTGYFILVLLTADSNILLYDISGKFIQEYDPGHAVYLIATGPHTDEYTFSTLGYDNSVRTHLVEYKRFKLNETLKDNATNTHDKKKDSGKFYYSFEVNLDSEFSIHNNSEANEINDLPKLLERETIYNCYTTYMMKGLKYHVLGDKYGNIIVFQKNGTFKSKTNIDSNSIISLHRHYPSILFTTSKVIGFFNPSQGIIATPFCDSPSEEIIHLATDTSNNNIFYVLLNNLEILVYEIKSSQNNCKIIYKLNSAYGKAKAIYTNYKLHATKNYLLLQNENANKSNNLKVFNITDMGYEEQQDQEGFDLIIQDNKISNDSLFIFSFQKNNLYSSFISAIETDTDNETSLINLFELVVPQKSQGDFFSNMRFPIILLSIVFAVGYQIWNRRKTSKGFNEYDKLEGLKNTIDSLSKNPNLNPSFLDKNLGGDDNNKSFDSAFNKKKEKPKPFGGDEFKGFKAKQYPTADRDEDHDYDRYGTQKHNLNDIEEEDIDYKKKRL